MLMISSVDAPNSNESSQCSMLSFQRPIRHKERTQNWEWGVEGGVRKDEGTCPKSVLH